MKKILIAIDYNPSSQKVAETGYELAALMGGEVCLLHVMAEISHYGMTYPTFMGYEGYDAGAIDVEMMNEMHKVTEEYLRSVKNHLNDPTVISHLAEGDAANSILEYANQWRADVIVMGTHSHSILERLLMGTVASKVIEKTSVPVYMVPVKKE